MTAAQLRLMAGGLVAVIAGGLYVRQYERHQGALAVIVAQYDSTQKVRDSTARVATQEALGARQAASDSARRALALVGQARALQRTTDSVAKEAGNAREAAERAVADTSTSLLGLRDDLKRLVDLSRRDSAGSAAQHAGDQRAIAALLRSHTADSTALQRGLDAEHALTARAVAAEGAVTALKGLQPSFLSRHLSVGVGYGALVSAGKVETGPVLSVGIRLWP